MTGRRHTVEAPASSLTAAIWSPLLSSTVSDFLTEPYEGAENLTTERIEVEARARIEVDKEIHTRSSAIRTRSILYTSIGSLYLFGAVYFAVTGHASGAAASLVTGVLVGTATYFSLAPLQERRGSTQDRQVTTWTTSPSRTPDHEDPAFAMPTLELSRKRGLEKTRDSISEDWATETVEVYGDPLDEHRSLIGHGFRVSANFILIPASTVNKADLHSDFLLDSPGSKQLNARLAYRNKQADLAILEIQNHRSKTQMADILSSLGSTLQRQSIRSGAFSNLDKAISILEHAVSLTEWDDVRGANRLSNLGTALQTRYRRLGDPEDLNRAVTLLRAAVQKTAPEQPNRAAILSNLGAALQSRFDQAGDPRDLTEAVDLLQQATDGSDKDDTERAGRLSNLAAALQVRYRRLGDPEDLNRAVTLLRAAVQETAPEQPNRAAILSNLGAALQSRYHLAASSDDLSEAIEYFEQAVSASPFDDPDHTVMASNLGNALIVRFQNRGDTEDLERAIATLEHAVSWSSPSHPDRAVMEARLNAAIDLRQQGG